MLRTYIRKTIANLSDELKLMFDALIKYEARFILTKLDKLIEMYEPEVLRVRQFSDYLDPAEIHQLDTQFDECVETLNQIIEDENQKHLI